MMRESGSSGLNLGIASYEAIDFNTLAFNIYILKAKYALTFDFVYATM